MLKLIGLTVGFRFLAKAAVQDGEVTWIANHWLRLGSKKPLGRVNDFAEIIFNDQGGIITKDLNLWLSFKWNVGVSMRVVELSSLILITECTTFMLESLNFLFDSKGIVKLKLAQSSNLPLVSPRPVPLQLHESSSLTLPFVSHHEPSHRAHPNHAHCLWMSLMADQLVDDWTSSNRRLNDWQLRCSLLWTRKQNESDLFKLT